ncbi:MAG: YbaK/EbsC family protein [Candidatus Shapirobacteria bacterium]|jgi:Ala-tRNA(Pro) deacylase
MNTVPQISLYDKLISYLKEKSVNFREISHRETKTSVESAAARGTKLKQGAKALLMFADNNPVLIVLSAAKKLDNAAFKKQFEVKDLRMATPEEVKQVSQVDIGAVPPFGNLFGVPVYVDEGFLLIEEIAFNAGSLSRSVIMKSADWKKLTTPKIGTYAI